MDKGIIRKLLTRKSNANKYDFGHVLIIGGSSGMVGAPFLAAMGALRAGAGLVTIASTPEVIDKLEKRVVEIMTLRFSINPDQAVKAICEFIEQRKVSVVVVGPGMSAQSLSIVKDLIAQNKVPTILDAGAFTCFRDDLELLDKGTQRNLDIIGTPHDGEFEKLTGIKLPIEVEARKDIVSRFVQAHRMTLLCKGFPTLVAHPDGSIYENRTGNPGLATAGSGDVLSGVIAGLVAQGCDVSEAADIGAYLHGLAADLAVKVKTQPGLIASDIAEFLPQAFQEAT